ncbi:MAG: sigma-70 family RNA polymerase sigma factor [Verrucomicrobiales bacterium]|nr:sigma-70 family RNA polymerase sigma factor [Verrucomicrobiales bacterium]
MGSPYGFQTTCWTVVAQAGASGSPDATLALETVCLTCRSPVLTYIRRLGYNPTDAEDLAQAFFGWVVEHNPLSAADPRKGRFRSFLLGTLKHFLSDERKRCRALKRGGGQSPISMDALNSEVWLAEEPSVAATAEDDYDRQWALALLERSLVALEEEYGSQGKRELFRALVGFQLAGDSGEPYKVVSARLGMSEAAVKTAIHRLRRRHSELLRHEVARTVSCPADVDGELRHLINLMSG